MLAKWKLFMLGYRIIETNYRTRKGEIDIIARDKCELVFVEVRSRSGGEYGTPEESVDARKVKKLTELAMTYIAQKSLYDIPARFDVVSVDFSRFYPKITVIKNAFEAVE